MCHSDRGRCHLVSFRRLGPLGLAVGLNALMSEFTIHPLNRLIRNAEDPGCAQFDKAIEDGSGLERVLSHTIPLIRETSWISCFWNLLYATVYRVESLLRGSERSTSTMEYCSS